MPHTLNRSLDLSGLPLWQGVHDSPRPLDILPFDLDLDPVGFVRQASSPDIRRRMAEVYARKDYSFITPPPGVSEWANTLGRRKLTALEAACSDLDGLNVLEIGAGSLFVAESLMERFAIKSYVAVDPTLPASRSDRIEVLPNFFPCEALAGRQFDLIIGFSCLEHVPDPTAFLRACRQTLSPHARGIFLTFPDCSRAFAQGDLSILVHEHLSYFDRIGAENILSAAGFEAHALQSTNDLFHCLATAKAQEEPPALCQQPDIAGAISAMRHTVSTLGNALRLHLERGHALAIHGANPNANNLLWLSGLAGDERIRVFDNDASKWGRYLPTCPNPIASPDSPEYRQADAIYVAATSFLDEIRRTLAAQGIDAGRVHPMLAAGNND